MKIWLINPYGPIPGEGWRDYRFTLIARALAADGHEVIWWTSSFSHHFKRQRANGWTDRIVEDQFLLRLVPSPGYQKNVGLGRVWRDLVFGWRTYRRGAREASPELIFFYESPFTFGFAGYRLAQAHGAQMVFDQMDLWPEIIQDALHPVIRLLSWPLFAICYAHRRRVYRRLHGSCALATPYLTAMHRVAPELTNRPACVVYNGINVAEFRRGLVATPIISLPIRNAGEIWAIYAGSLGETYDIDTLLIAAVRLQAHRANLRILIAGDGPLREKIAQAVMERPGQNLVYLGKLSPEHLIPIYSQCDIGLCSYSSRSNVEMPDKLYDYTAAGLAVLNSLRGEIAGIVSKHCIGLQYRSGDAADMTAKLIALVSNPDALRSMKTASFALGSTFDLPRQMEQMTRLIRAVTQRTGFSADEITSLRSVNCRPLTLEEVPAAVALHRLAFPSFFLSSLGERFLTEFYRAFLSNDSAVALTAIDSRGRLLGVAVGTLNPEGFFKRLLVYRWWSFVLASIINVLMRPRILPRLARAILYRGDAASSNGRALLSSIAVAPWAQGNGIGMLLLSHWLREVQARGKNGIYLTTDAEDNAQVNRFYQMAGAKLATVFFTPEGRKMNRYTIDLSPN